MARATAVQGGPGERDRSGRVDGVIRLWNPTSMSRRHKSYAAETGVAYTYFFESQRSVTRPGGLGQGADYVFVVTAGQGMPFAVRVFISRRATSAWQATHGRELDPREQYAAAKMRLFRAFDELADLREESLSLVIDEADLEGLLEILDLP